MTRNLTKDKKTNHIQGTLQKTRKLTTDKKTYNRQGNKQDTYIDKENNN